MEDAVLLTCKNCGIQFIYEHRWAKGSDRHNGRMPTLCHSCWKKYRNERQHKQNMERHKEEQQRRVIESIKQQEMFTLKLKSWNVVPMENIHPTGSKSLFILGNGFDLMHGVKSSYYDFRDFLRKTDPVRETLEDNFHVPNLWSNLEESLAYFDLNRMCNDDAIDEQLDIMDANNEEAGMAEYEAAIEMAIQPLQVIALELPRKLLAWVDTLDIGTKDRPLSALFGNDEKVLCFNYTEFVETLYHVPSDHVLYLHGSRKKIKNKFRENLIFGHLPGLSDGAYNLEKIHVYRRNSYRRELVRAAQEQAVYLATEYDVMLTKNCTSIIDNNKSFFSFLTNVENVIVIGHSLSKGDWAYFAEVNKSIPKTNAVKWYVGCHGLNDLNNLEHLCAAQIIPQNSVFLFRTDNIQVNVEAKPMAEVVKRNTIQNERCLAIVNDGSLQAKAKGNIFWLESNSDKLLELEVPGWPSKAVFICNEKQLILKVNGLYPVLYLFHADSNKWHFVNELLVPGEYKDILNRRLNHIYVNDSDLKFVYNNRFYQFDIHTGNLQKNIAERGVRFKQFVGKDIFRELM